MEQLHRARPEGERVAVLLFALSGESPLTIVNGEIVAVEVLRALVGSLGIVAAVPITTFAAAWLLVPADRATPTSDAPA